MHLLLDKKYYYVVNQLHANRQIIINIIFVPYVKFRNTANPSSTILRIVKLVYYNQPYMTTMNLVSIVNVVVDKEQVEPPVVMTTLRLQAYSLVPQRSIRHTGEQPSHNPHHRQVSRHYSVDNEPVEQSVVIRKYCYSFRNSGLNPLPRP